MRARHARKLARGHRDCVRLRGAVKPRGHAKDRAVFDHLDTASLRRREGRLARLGDVKRVILLVRLLSVTRLRLRHSVSF